MATQADVRRIAMSMPGAVEAPGRFAFEVRMLALDSEKFFTEPHYNGAALLAGIGIAHSYLGERYILMRLFRRADLPQILGSEVFTKRTRCCSRPMPPPSP